MSTKLDRKFISLSETDNHMAILVLTTSMTSVQWSIIQDYDDFSLKVTKFQELRSGEVTKMAKILLLNWYE